jgi:hypothetical protein
MSPRVVDALAPLAVVWAVAAPARAQVSTPAAAQRKAPRLEYKRGPAECVSEEKFRGEVSYARGGRDLFDATAPDVLRVWFEKIPGGYRGTIQYTDAAGKTESPTTLTDDNCRMLARWVGSSASIYIPRPPQPPTATAPAPTAAEPTEPTPAEKASESIPCASAVTWAPPPLPPESLRGSEPPRKMDLTIAFSTTVLATAGFTADVGAGLQIGAEWRPEMFSLGVEVRGLFPGRAVARDVLDPTKSSYPATFDLSQLTGLLVPCVRGWKYLFGCGVLQVGMMIYDDAKDSHQRTGITPQANLGPRVGFEVPFAERFAVFGFGEALFAPKQSFKHYDLPNPQGGVANVGFTQSVVSGFFGVGLSVRFSVH